MDKEILESAAQVEDRLLQAAIKQRDKPQANERQVGGDHYRTSGVQHWDLAAARHYDYFQGQITKYIDRWKTKGGLVDLQKAAHFLQKYIEVHHMFYEPSVPPTTPVPTIIYSYNDNYGTAAGIQKLMADFIFIGYQGKTEMWECKRCRKQMGGVNVVEACFNHICPVRPEGQPSRGYVDQG